MATITRKEWNNYITLLRSINNEAVIEFLQFVEKNNGYMAIERQDLIDYAFGLATKYGEASAAVSAEMYDAMAALSGAYVPPALPAETATYQDVAKTVNGIIKNTANEEILAQGIGRLVKMAGTDTMLSNAYRDRPKTKGSKKRHSGAQVAWIPAGDTCPYCIMLASAGWRSQTEWGANQHTEHIHSNCDCTYAVRFNDSLYVEGYEPEEYRQMYDDADPGGSRKDKLNAMRREAYAENKEEINEQKRSAYEKRKERNSSEAEEINVD